MKITRKLISDIENKATTFFEFKSDGCHDWSHVERVRKIAMHIGKAEKANLLVLELAALLHDIGREEEIRSRGKLCHAMKGAEMTSKILEEYGIDTEIIEQVSDCVRTHRNRSTKRPKSLEAKIIFDADKLDSIGAVGIGRVFMFAGITSGVLCTGREKELAKSEQKLSYTREDTAPLEYEIKLKHIKDKMLTKEGRRMATERHLFMKQFFERFWEEVEGKI